MSVAIAASFLNLLSDKLHRRRTQTFSAPCYGQSSTSIGDTGNKRTTGQLRVKRGFHPTQTTQRNERKQRKKRKKRSERNSHEKRKLQPIGTEVSSLQFLRFKN